MLFHVGLLALPIIVAATSFQQSNLTALFSPSLSPGAEIFLPTNPDDDEDLTQRWSLAFEPSFVLNIKPATNEDVQNIVKIASESHIPFFATGGAHGAELGFATVKNAVNIDLGNFNSTELDAANNLLTVGGSTTFSQFYDLLYNAGKEIQTGNAPCVNMVGATIGAGVGPLEGLHGLVLDALVSVRMVTASGQLVTASDDENGDLFWAVRGAGANFGIITSATYRVHNHTNGGQAVNADFIFPPAANVSLFEVLKSWDDDDVFPQNLGLEIAASFNHTSQLPNLDANFIFYGTQEAAQPYLDKLIALNPLRYQNLSVGWNNLTNVAGFGHASGVCARGDYTTHYSLGANRTDVATFSAFFDNFTAFSAANPWFDGSFALERYNTKAALAVPESERGVYPWRDIKTLVIFENVYPNSSHDAAVAAFYGPVRRAFQAVSGFAVPHVYVNYGYGDEGPAAWYGAHNLPRLSALKRKWDPRGYFGAGNPVPLSWEGEGEGDLIR